MENPSAIAVDLPRTDVEARAARTFSARPVLMLTAAIAIAETLIMLLLPSIAAGWPDGAAAALDTVLLVVLVSPALVVFVVRPLQRELERRRELERTLRTAAAELERRVAARTEEIGVANERLNDGMAKLRRHSETLEVLLQTSEALYACAEAKECYDVLARCMLRLDPASRGAVFVHREAGEPLERVAVWGRHPDAPERFPEAACRAMCGVPANRAVDDADQRPCAHGCGSDAKAVCVPLGARGEKFGLLHVIPGGLPMRRADGDDDVLLLAAGTLSLALANLRLRESLQRQVSRDPLTGLYNRRHLEESMTRELSRAEREEVDVSVLMLDLDHFKCINDTHGHPAGDTLLRELGARLARFFRTEDLVCRIGGEEFCIVLPGMTKKLAARRAEELRSVLGALEVEHEGTALDHVTTSIGVATFPDDALTADELLRVADRAMYAAKREGRDRVVVAGRETVAGKHAS